MPVACKLEDKARPFHSFKAASFLNRLTGGPLHSLALQHVARRLPAGAVREVNEPGNPAYGWLDAGGVVVNTGRELRADTPLHELTHLWLLMLRHGKKGEQGRRYDALTKQLTQDPAYQKLAQHYPLSETYAYSDQVEEVSAQLVGQLAARRLALAQVPVVGRLLALAEQLVGRYLGLGGAVLTKPLYEVVSALAADVLSEAPLDVDAQWLAQHVQYARYQGADLPATAHELLGRLSGKGAGVSQRRVDARAASAIEQLQKGATEVELQNPLGGNPIKPPLDHLTLPQRIDFVKEHYRQLLASRTAVAGDGAMTLLALPSDQLGKILSGDWDSLPAHPTYTRDSLKALAMELRNVFGDVQPEDSIVRYSEATMPPGSYDPTFDDGLTLVHLRPRRDGSGQPITEAVIVRLLSNTHGAREADLTAKRDDKPLLSGLYGGSWGAAAKGWATKKFFGLTMTGSSFNRSMLSATSLGLHLTDRGFHVVGVGVGKIDMDSTPDVQRNDVRRYPLTEYLQAWQNLARIADVQKLLPARLQELLAKPKLLETLTYEQDYLRNLGTFAQGKGGLSAVVTALGEYEASQRHNSARGLIQAIEARLGALRQLYGENRQAYYKSPEVVALGQAHVQLQGIMMLANKHADIGAFEQYVRAFNAGDNPILQWFYEAWRSAREHSVGKFLTYQRDRLSFTNALEDDYHKEEGMLNPFRHDEGKYYEPLFEKSTQTFTDKQGRVRTMELNEHRFKMPGTPAFAKLRPAQRAYIEWALGAIKESTIERYVATNAKGRKSEGKLRTEALKKYEETWGKGYVPLITGSVTRTGWASVTSGEYNAQALDGFQNMLDENYTYDQQANSNKNTLSDVFAMQAGKTAHGSESRLEMLGLMATSEVDADGNLRASYVLDPEQGRVRNLSLEPDFRRVIDQFVMNNLKHEQAEGLQTKKLTAVALIRSGFKESGELRGTQERNEDGTPAENTSRVEDSLNKMYDYLALGKKNQVKQSEAVRRLGQFLAASGNVAALGALGFSVKTAVASLAGNLSNAVDVGLANWGQQNGLTLPMMTKALGQFQQPGKLWAMSKLLRTLDMDEHAILESFMNNGTGLKGLKASDILQESFIMDRMGDIAVRMWLTASQMMQDGSWDAYDWDEKKGELTYNEAKHRQLKGDAYVDAVKRRMLETGELGLDAHGEPLPMTRGNDDRMRGAIEAWNGEVQGNYKEEVATTMATNIFLRMIQKFRVFLLKKIDDWTKDERSNTNMGYYDAETGQWVSRQEVGLFTSFSRLLGGVGLNNGNALKTWQQLSEADRYNLKKVAAGSLVTMAALALTAAVFDDDDEEEKKYGVAYNAVQSLVRDNFIFYQFKAASEAALSPMVALAFLDRMRTALGDYLVGDWSAGNRIVTRNMGVFKTGDWMRHILFDEPKKKKNE